FLVLVVIPLAARAAAKAPRNPADQLVVIDIQLHDRIELDVLLVEHLLERFSLRNVARETVENKALLAVGSVQAIRDHLDCNIIRYKLARLHDAVDLLAKLRLVLDVLAEEVARRDVGDAILPGDDAGLCAFAGARRSNQQDSHLRAPLSLAFLIRPSYWCA